MARGQFDCRRPPMAPYNAADARAVAPSYFVPFRTTVNFEPNYLGGDGRSLFEKENYMRILLTSALALTVILAGCDKPKSPEAVAHDVAAAQQKASTEVSNSEKEASKDMGNAAGKVGDNLTQLNNTAAKDAEKIAVAKADGDRKVALAQCSALAGDARKKCKDE